MRIVVLGAGRMGYGAAYDLAHSQGIESVTVADIDSGKASEVATRIDPAIVTAKKVDVSDTPGVVTLMRGHDAAISCVVYHFNEQLARAAIEARVHFCDLGGNNSVVASEVALDEQAREAGVTIIPDCGLAPGMTSVLAAHGASRFETLERVRIRVGGLPQRPRPPLNYQLVFSVEGLINEYVERARIIRNGAIVEVDSMSELETLDFQPLGELEAFHTSGGTSTLPDTFHGRIPNLDYKTIRYPGHCEKFKTLIELGLTGSDEVDIDGIPVRPRRLLGEMLQKRLPAGEPDLVLVRIEFTGVMDRRQRMLRYEIIDRYDEHSGLSAMMRTTAYPASIIAQMMARGDISASGAIPQEQCVPTGLFIEELAKRNIHVTEQLTEMERGS